MRNSAKLLIALLITNSLLFLVPNSTNALPTPLPFGGLASFSVPCTCSGNLWIWFTPLYLGGPINITGPMIYSPYSSILYAYFMIGIPGIWHLGSYIPGVQSCWMAVPTVPPACIPLPAAGQIFQVGTNKFF